MSLIDDALAARRDQLVAALHDHPTLRDKLSLAEITTAVDAALQVAQIRPLLDAAVASQALAQAVMDDVPTPPASVVGAIDEYAIAEAVAREQWNVYAP